MSDIYANPVEVTYKSNHKQILTEEQIDEIIQKLLNTNQSLRSIGTEYNVPHGIIINIKNGIPKYRRSNLQYPLRPNR